MKSKVVETLATGCESFAADARAKIYTQWVSKRRRCLKAGALRAEDQRGRQDKYHPEVSVCSQSAALKALLCSFRRLSKGGRGLFLIIANTFHFFSHFESLFIFHLFISSFFKSFTEAITFKNCFQTYNSSRPELSRLCERNHFAIRWTPSKEFTKESVCSALLQTCSLPRIPIIQKESIKLRILFYSYPNTVQSYKDG